MTRREAEILFEERLAGEPPLFCDDFQAWAEDHPTLWNAWESCERPAWMMWWLTDHLHAIDPLKANELMDELHGHDRWTYGGAEYAPDVAAKLRERFTYWGEQRSPETK